MYIPRKACCSDADILYQPGSIEENSVSHAPSQALDAKEETLDYFYYRYSSSSFRHTPTNLYTTAP